MEKYIGVKLIEAEPCKEAVTGEERREGYKVRYPDGYESWSPKDVFEKAYFKIVNYPKLKCGALYVSNEMIDEFIKETYVETRGKTTIVHATLINGFEIVESSACVDPALYDEQVGYEICIRNIKDKIWELLGFVLQTAVGGVKK